MSVIHTYTLDNVILSVEFTTSSQLKNGNRVSVIPFYEDNRGRKCKKTVHNNNEPYIWWNSQKIMLNNYDVLSPEVFVKKWKERTLRFDEVVSVLERNENFAIIVEHAKGAFTIYQKAEVNTPLCYELGVDSRAVLTYFLEGRAGGYRYLKLRKDTLHYSRESFKSLITKLRYKNGCPVFLQKPIDEYNGKYLYVDDNYQLQEADKLSIKYLICKHIKGWENAGLKGTTNDQMLRDINSVRASMGME